MIDVHVHLAALPDGKNGCYISPKMLNGWLFRGFIRSMGLPLNDPARASEMYIDRLLGKLRASTHVRQAILLGMDGVYGDDGRLHKEETEFLITNDYVLATAKRFPQEFLPGISINPRRRDAVEELERCAAAGAVLVKVLPNAQHFDPASPAFHAFWQALARLRMPILTHIGYEFSLIGKDQSVGRPERWRAALDAGVTVIAAHGMSQGLVFREPYWPLFLDFVNRYPNFYWDASALSLPNRTGMLLRIARHPEVHDRMIFGTDYPLGCHVYPALLAGKWKAYGALRALANPFDRHYELLRALGLPVEASGVRLAALLRRPVVGK